MRTFSSATFREAQAAWVEGDFGDEWDAVRLLAADRGFIYPPEGTRWDQREDASPSQRAILYAAIGDTPTVLRQAIEQSRSWSEVVRFLIDWQDARALTLGIEEELEARRKAALPGRDDAELTLTEIRRRIGVSS